MTRQVEALIAGAYLSGTNTRRVKRALAALFGGAVGKDVVSRTWRKVKTDWDAWNQRDLAGEDIVCRRLNAGNGSLNKPETTPPTYFHHLRDGTPNKSHGIGSSAWSSRAPMPGSA